MHGNTAGAAHCQLHESLRVKHEPLGSSLGGRHSIVIASQYFFQLAWIKTVSIAVTATSTVTVVGCHYDILK